MKAPCTCISLLSARRVSSSFSEQIGCIQSDNTRKPSVGNFSWKTCTYPVFIKDELRVKL